MLHFVVCTGMPTVVLVVKPWENVTGKSRYVSISILHTDGTYFTLGDFISAPAKINLRNLKGDTKACIPRMILGKKMCSYGSPHPVGTILRASPSWTGRLQSDQRRINFHSSRKMSVGDESPPGDLSSRRLADLVDAGTTSFSRSSALLSGTRRLAALNWPEMESLRCIGVGKPVSVHRLCRTCFRISQDVGFFIGVYI